MKKLRKIGYVLGGTGLCLFLWTLAPGLAGERTDKMDNKPDKVIRSNAEWKKMLTPLQYRILRKKGTERAGTGKFTKHKEQGIYTCAGCGAELFSSSDKYDSGCGWPSFTQPKAEQQVDEKLDRTHGMIRTEVVCSRCDGHLGHVFNDGPRPTGQRYCINSASLNFKASEADDAKKDNARTELATFGAGCFWCSEAVFEGMKGVKSVVSGYSGGKTPNPTYKAVCSGMTGHAEVIQIEYDPSTVTYEELLRTFWKMHDPTTLNRQGGDIGTQYRSAVFYHSDEQKKTAEAVRASLEKEKVFRRPIVTEISPARTFYKAEDYHQDYFENNPDKAYCRRVIAPKLKKLGRL